MDKRPRYVFQLRDLNRSKTSFPTSPWSRGNRATNAMPDRKKWVVVKLVVMVEGPGWRSQRSQFGHKTELGVWEEAHGRRSW